jgi:hypothetical protein
MRRRQQQQFQRFDIIHSVHCKTPSLQLTLNCVVTVSSTVQLLLHALTAPNGADPLTGLQLRSTTLQVVVPQVAQHSLWMMSMQAVPLPLGRWPAGHAAHSPLPLPLLNMPLLRQHWLACTVLRLYHCECSILTGFLQTSRQYGYVCITACAQRGTCLTDCDTHYG